MRVLEEAPAPRRLLVITDMSDFRKNRKQRLKYLGPAVSRAAEVAVFIGENAAYGKRRAIKAGMAPENVRVFTELEAAARFMSGAEAR